MARYFVHMTIYDDLKRKAEMVLMTEEQARGKGYDFSKLGLIASNDRHDIYLDAFESECEAREFINSNRE